MPEFSFPLKPGRVQGLSETMDCRQWAVRWEKVLDVVPWLDGSVSTGESMCIYIYMDIPFSYPTIILSKRIQQLPKFVAEKAEQEAAAGQWGSLTYGALHEPRTLLAFPLMVTGKHNDCCKREEREGSSKPFYAFWLWHCTDMKKVWGAHTQLFRFVSSVQTGELCRVTELLSRVSYVKRWQDFCYTGKSWIHTSDMIWYYTACPHSPAVNEICSPCQAAQKARPWHFLWAAVSSGNKML